VTTWSTSHLISQKLLEAPSCAPRHALDQIVIRSVDQHVLPSAIPPTPRTSRRRRPLDRRFRRLTCRVSTHRQSPTPDFVSSVAPQTDHVPSCHMLLELERLINAFSSAPLFPPLTRRPRIAYGSSNVRDTNDSASACGIDGLLQVFDPSH